MTGFTTYFVNKVMDHSLGGVSWTPPTTVYLKLHVGNPGPDGTANPAATSSATTGTNIRKAATWSAAANGLIALAADVTWVATAKESISHISGWDAVTAGNCLFTDELEEAKNLYVGDTFDLSAATLQITPEA